MANSTWNILKIGGVWNSPTGTMDKQHFTVRPDFAEEDQIKLKQNLDFDLEIYRIKEGLAVIVKNLQAQAIQHCSKCLDQLQFSIHVDESERKFLAPDPMNEPELFENFLINVKEMTIDIAEFIRQEIILHFPLIPVCSDRCKGLCSACGANLNHQKHHSDCQVTTAKNDSDTSYKPFANLKDLIQ